MRGQFVNEALVQADAMLEVVERLRPGALAALAEDPIDELQRWPDIQLRFEPEAGGGGRCSVAGNYIEDTEPPTLVVAQSSAASVIRQWGRCTRSPTRSMSTCVAS